jgi:hypothetical protein
LLTAALVVLALVFAGTWVFGRYSDISCDDAFAQRLNTLGNQRATNVLSFGRPGKSPPPESNRQPLHYK